jgi:hypothetical protein
MNNINNDSKIAQTSTLHSSKTELNNNKLRDEVDNDKRSETISIKNNNINNNNNNKLNLNRKSQTNNNCCHYRTRNRNFHYRLCQCKIYNFLERPRGWKAGSYHILM